MRAAVWSWCRFLCLGVRGARAVGVAIMPRHGPHHLALRLLVQDSQARTQSPKKNFWCTVYHSKSLNILNIIEPKTARIWFNDTPVWIEVPVVDTFSTKHALKCFKFRVPVDSVTQWTFSSTTSRKVFFSTRCRPSRNVAIGFWPPWWGKTPPVWALKLQCRGTSRSPIVEVESRQRLLKVEKSGF